MSGATLARRSATLAVAVALLCGGTAAAQSSRLEGGVSSHPGFDFFYETRLEPPVPPLSDGFGMTVLETPPNVLHRVMLDRAARVYFGYNVRVDVLPDNFFRVAFGSLTMTAELQKVLDGDAAAWRMLPTPVFPAPRTIRGGEVLELPLLVNSGWGQKLTDYVTVREPGARTFGIDRREFSFAAGPPRDFTVDDAELRVSRPMVMASGRDGPGPAMTMRRQQMEGDFAGTLLWLYVPYRGRFLLSLRPHAELKFQKAGEVRGSSMRFTMGGTSYSLVSASRIAPGQTAFNLYVLFQPGWTPLYPHANVDVFHFGAADRVDFAVKK